MSKFKVGDTVRCVDGTCPYFLDYGATYTVEAVSSESVFVTDRNGSFCPFYKSRFELEFTPDCAVECTNATGSDLTEGRFYTVREITDGGALILHGSDSRPYRRDRFALADNSEWVSQTIRERDAARTEFEAKTLTIESCDTITMSPPNHNSGWDVEIDHTTNPMSPTVKLKKRSFRY